MGRDPVRRWVGIVGGVALGAVLLFAAWTKALDPGAFAEQIRAEGLDGVLSAPTVAWIALALEIGLGFALLFGVRRPAVLVPAALLIVFFLFLTGRAYWYDLRGIEREASACGCFGHLVERSPAEAFWGDLALLGVPWLLAWWGRSRERRRGLAAPVAAVLATVAGLVFAWKAPELPLDDLATRLSPGVTLSQLCAGSGAERICFDGLAPDLEEGEHLIVLLDLTDELDEAAFDALQSWSLEGREPAVTVLADASPEQLHAFTFRWGPAFEIVLAPGPLLRPLYRTLPRSFRVVDGTVVETWPGWPAPLIAGS
ncbi:MAG: hypothetical protein R2991_15060 [Thermoanaerobaculia bacterium]